MTPRPRGALRAVHQELELASECLLRPIPPPQTDPLAGGLSRHLAHEERETLPLLSHTLTAAEWQGFVADQRRKGGIRGAAQLFPWLLDEASPGQARAVLSQLPALLRVVCRRIWQPRYTRRAHWNPR